ncbi:hypothetical protein ACA910_015120 [Epithemia clementina (nom. ined.)]
MSDDVVHDAKNEVGDDADNNDNNDEENQEDSPSRQWQEDPADVHMNRGSLLRRLREMERQDNEARRRTCPDSSVAPQQVTEQRLHEEEEEQHESTSNDASPISDCILEYQSYLSHQRYYDDLKHIDYKFIDFGRIRCADRSDKHTTSITPNAEHTNNALVIEQDKSLGKGGLCWDAAFCLGEHLIQTQDEWLTPLLFQEPSSDHNTTSDDNKQLLSVIELGCGTGLCGMMVAKGVPGVSVSLTDLPSLLPIMNRNMWRNFELDRIILRQDLDNHESSCFSPSERNTNDPKQEDSSSSQLLQPLLDGRRGSKGCVTSFALDWDDVVQECLKHNSPVPETKDKGNLGQSQRIHSRQQYDVVIGADVVATLYNPTALAQTIYHVAKDKHSFVFISFKERLSSVHRQFETELEKLFDQVSILPASSIQSRNRNPQVGILVARAKKMHVRFTQASTQEDDLY